MDYSPLGHREVTVCDVNANMLRYGQRKAAKQGYTTGKLIQLVLIIVASYSLFVNRDYMGTRRCHKPSICR